MGLNAKTQKATYGFEPEFERALITLCCSRPTMYGRVGSALDPEGIDSEVARLALQAARAIAEDLGRGPDKAVIVIQRLRRWQQQGRVTQEQIEAVNDLFDQAEDAGLPAEESIISEVAPVLRRRYQQAAVEMAMDEYAKRGDFAQVAQIIEKAQRVGEADTSVGTRLGSASFDAIEQIRHMERLPTGIPELDMVLDGGLWRGAEAMVVGGAGDGKSMFLSHQASEGLMLGLHVLMATLELPEAVVLSRIKSNLTGVPINNILDGQMDVAKQRLENMSGQIGTCVVKYFSPHTTTVEDIKEWLKACEDREGRPVDLLVIDYADKLTAKVDRDSGEYKAMRVVYEGLRILAVDRKLWCWTASQKRRSAEKGKKKADVDDVADSIHKSRVADMVITLNARGDENDQLLFHVAKNRLGRSHVSVGPLPHDFSCGRVVPVNR